MELLIEKNISPDRAESLARLSEGSVGQALELAELSSYEPANPLSPFAAADALPKELFLARTQVELALHRLSQTLRLRHLRGQLSFSRVERPLRELRGLGRALKSNADPRLILTLGYLEAEPLL